MEKKKTIYLNTSDIYSDNNVANHCDAEFDLSRMGLNAIDAERLSLSLVKTLIPTRTTYLTYSGTEIVLSLKTTEPATNTAIGADDNPMVLLITNHLYTEPFWNISEDRVQMAVPFYICQAVSDIVNFLNMMLDFRMDGDDEATSAFDINTYTGLLETNGTYTLSFNNLYWWSYYNQYDEFSINGVKIGKMLGINVSDFSTVHVYTIMNASNPSINENRLVARSYPCYVASEGLMITTNLAFDSFSTLGGGVTNVLSEIPTSLGIMNQRLETLVEDGDTLVMKYRNGMIYHENTNILGSHKTVSNTNIDILRLQVRGLNNSLRWCNSNITYVIEVRWI